MASFRKGSGKSALRTPHSALVDAEFLLKLDRLTLSIGRDLVSGLMGEHSAVRRTAGIEFADYRPYNTGDDLRRVDWNAYARLGTLHIRQAQAEHDTVLYILLDASPSMDFGTPTKFYAARRLASALGYIALAHLDSVVLAVPGLGDDGRRTTDDGESNPEPNPKSKIQNPKFRGRAESASLFHYLQELQTALPVGFDDTLAAWGGHRGQGRVAIVISDLLLDDYRAGVRALVGAGFQVTLLHLLSHEELHPPVTGDVELIDSETGRQLEVHLGPESLAEYHRRLDAWLDEAEQWCYSSGASYIRIQNDWDIERVLLETLKRHGVTA
ncbi:MAG TPA: DUF58 domain-containing protein [Chloroflexia bacterium]|nr:DUF58 domain-containing protein [Chloroflexia bacterium]